MENYNVTVIIPSLNPDEKLTQTVMELERVGFNDIVIVDDGSDECFVHNFPDLSLHPSCTIIRHRKNKGKGAALKTAFKYVLKYRNQSFGVVTVDADGQHLAEDVLRCTQKMINSKSVVLGCRDFSSSNVPLKSRFGNRLTRGVMRLLCGVRLSDTQTGLRAIPSLFLPTFIDVAGDRYEYETNMLIEFKKQGIPFLEEIISTVYIDENKGSHFRPVRDSLRVYKFILSFVFNSVICTLLEITLFYCLIKFLFNDAIVIATALARVCSATVNFTLNRKTVFKTNAKIHRTIIRYIILAIPLVLISGNAVKLFSFLFKIESEFALTLIKALIDAVLFFASFRIQQNWVFANQKKQKCTKIKTNKKLTLRKILARIGISVLSFVLMLAVSVFALVGVVAYGPSTTIRDMLVLSAMQASATKWVPGLFLSDEEVEAIVNSSHDESELIISSDGLVNIEGGDSSEVEQSIDGMKYITRNYLNFKAYILLVADPKRVYVGTSSDNYASATEGKILFDMAEKEDCIAMINGGEFDDPGGNGRGAQPVGLTYSNGECVWNDGANRTFIGIDKSDRLIVRENLTKSEAEKLNVRDGVSFQRGNTLIKSDDSGVHIYYKENNTGAAQRTAIGQREDGTFILVVTDGRSANSIGATYNEVIDILLSYGAVDAGMLDGGSSAMMYYEDYFDKYDVDKSMLDKYQLKGMTNKYKALVPPRKIPTYFCVKR